MLLDPQPSHVSDRLEPQGDGTSETSATKARREHSCHFAAVFIPE
jgi:hypothetical protein